MYIFKFHTIFLSHLDVLSPRLTNGSSTVEGYLEVWIGNGWDKVCKTSARKPEAEVVCKELGFEMLEDYFINIKYGDGTGEDIFLNLDAVEMNKA